MISQDVSFALPKGRLAEQTVKLFVDKGICGADVVDFSSRKLIFEDKDAGVKFLLIRNSDVTTYVEHGAADFGVVGADVLTEAGSPLYEFYDLGFGACRMSVAAPKLDQEYIYTNTIRVATKNSNITKRAFADQGAVIEVIKLCGASEVDACDGGDDYRAGRG